MITATYLVCRTEYGNIAHTPHATGHISHHHGNSLHFEIVRHCLHQMLNVILKIYKMRNSATFISKVINDFEIFYKNVRQICTILLSSINVFPHNSQ